MTCGSSWFQQREQLIKIPMGTPGDECDWTGNESGRGEITGETITGETRTDKASVREDFRGFL